MGGEIKANAATICLPSFHCLSHARPRHGKVQLTCFDLKMYIHIKMDFGLLDFFDFLGHKLTFQGLNSLLPGRARRRGENVSWIHGIMIIGNFGKSLENFLESI